MVWVPLNLYEVTVVVLVRTFQIKSDMHHQFGSLIPLPNGSSNPLFFKHGTDPGQDLARRLSDPSFSQKHDRWQFETRGKRSLKNGGLEFKIRLYYSNCFCLARPSTMLHSFMNDFAKWVAFYWKPDVWCEEKGIYMLTNWPQQRFYFLSMVEAYIMQKLDWPFTVHKLLHSFAVPQFKIALEK